MRLARDQNNALLTDAFRPQSEQSVINFMVELLYNGGSINGTLYLALYGNILRSLVVHSNSLSLKAVEIKRFVSYFSNFTGMFGICVLCL